MSDTIEVGKVYDKIDKVFEVVTDTRLEVEKLRGDHKEFAAEVKGKLDPALNDVKDLKTRVDILEGRAKFNLGKKAAYGSIGAGLASVFALLLQFYKSVHGG